MKKLIKALLTKRKKCIPKLLLLAEKSKTDREMTEQMGRRENRDRETRVVLFSSLTKTDIKHKVMGFQKMHLHRRGCW